MNAHPRPLRIEVLKESAVDELKAGKILSDFLSKEIAVHSIPNNIAHQLTVLANDLNSEKGKIHAFGNEQSEED